MVDLTTLKRWINESKNIVAFTGAGVSTESGVPDFRSPGGIYDTSNVRTKEGNSTEICKLVHHTDRVTAGV